LRRSSNVILTLVAALLGFARPLLAEDDSPARVEELKGQVEGMNETMLEMQSTLSALAKVKISGYVQAQFRTGESDGQASFAGGSFPNGVHSQFMVRRGRLKVNYAAGLTQYVLQMDVTQNGVGIKDAYAQITDPWSKSLSLTAGVFDRPFGFEISYSSSSRESPERSRMFQTLFPGERELGAKIEYQPSGSLLNAKAGLFNGTGPTANENDNNKDLIGRVGFQLPFYDANAEIDGGVSFYGGKVRYNSKFVYAVAGDRWAVDSTSHPVGDYFDRNYLGLDLQSYFNVLPAGGSSVRFEFITGRQPSTSSSNSAYSVAFNAASTPLYRRDVSGWYLNAVQNIGRRNQVVLKFDVFDPNTSVEGSAIGKAGANFTPADIAYTTFGAGLVHHWDSNVKFIFYYDVVSNETVDHATTTANLVPFKEDLKDNVLTIRMQYRF